MKTLTRRHVIASFATAPLVLCPAVLNAQAADFSWDQAYPDDTPVNADRTLMLDDGEKMVEISGLAEGEVAVLGMPDASGDYGNTGNIRYIAVHRRTADQVAMFSAEDRAGTVQDPAYFIVDLTCPHRGYAIGLTGVAEAPFACLKTGSRHSSVFNGAGFGIAGASEDEYMTIPDYSLRVTGADVVVTFA